MEIKYSIRQYSYMLPTILAPAFVGIIINLLIGLVYMDMDIWFI